MILADRGAYRYSPKARPPECTGNFWEHLHTDRFREWLEFDVYDEVDEAVNKFLEKAHDSVTPLGSHLNLKTLGAAFL